VNETFYSESDKLKCKQALDAYKFPVMSMIMSPNGTVVHTINANDLLAQAHEESDAIMATIMSHVEPDRVHDPVSYVYRRFLGEAVEMISNHA
jgi:hypothetical protein